MVRRSIPLWRRVRAVRGQIFLALVWSAAAATCGVLLLFHPGVSSGTALAVTRTHLIRAPESGRLASLAVSPLQHVEAGDVLGTIEVPGLTQQLAAAEADLRALEAQLAGEQADRGRKFARDLDDARASWLGARVALEQDRAELSGLDQELARLQSPGVLLSIADVERVRVKQAAASVELDARTAEVNALKGAYADAQARAGSSATVALTAALDAATAKLEGLRLEADANVLRAHVSGVVTAPVGLQARDGRSEVIDETFPAPGQWVQAGVPVLMLTEAGTQDAVVFVDVARARGLTPGTEVSVRAQGGARYEATVRAIGAAVEPVPLRQLRSPSTPEWGVPVTLQVLDDVLLPGEALSVEF
jgi:multidrug resistance efflux pump